MLINRMTALHDDVMQHHTAQTLNMHARCYAVRSQKLLDPTLCTARDEGLSNSARQRHVHAVKLAMIWAVPASVAHTVKSVTRAHTFQRHVNSTCCFGMCAIHSSNSHMHSHAQGT